MTCTHLAVPLRRIAPALAFAAALAFAHTAAAQQQPRVDSLLKKSARMGDLVRLHTTGVGAWAQKEGHDPKKLVLFLNGRAMQGAVAQRVSGVGRHETWEVRLQRSDEARDAWEAVLGSPNRFERTVRTGLGPAAGPEFAIAGDSVLWLRLELAPRGWLWLPAVAWLALIVWFFHLARTTGIIRDPQPPIPPPPGDVPRVRATPAARSANPKRAAREERRRQRKERLDLRPYSMARTQMAFWFLLVTTAFLAIWIVTGDTQGVITTQAIFLIGLGAGTALAAGAVEKNKREEQAAVADRLITLDDQRRGLVVERAAAGPLSPPDAIDDEMLEVEAARAAIRRDTPDAPTSKGFFRDVLSDQDGPALHRYQHFVWTLIIGAIFGLGAYRTLALPKIDDTMLLLMGISAATYVGFKTREDQT
ncbi:MAG: hypothetical protein ACJ8J0_26370 [Longimicrobiaceae bacterium]